VSRKRTNECNGNNIARHGASGSAFDEVRRMAGSIPRVPDNDRGNRNWRAVRYWAEAHSSEILRVYDAVKSKTATAELLNLRSLSPFFTACLKEGRLDLVPNSAEPGAKRGRHRNRLTVRAWGGRWPGCCWSSGVRGRQLSVFTDGFNAMIQRREVRDRDIWQKQAGRDDRDAEASQP
jgi:hypothetical protein